jgi:hypothetical protein
MEVCRKASREDKSMINAVPILSVGWCNRMWSRVGRVLVRSLLVFWRGADGFTSFNRFGARSRLPYVYSSRFLPSVA